MSLGNSAYALEPTEDNFNLKKLLEDRQRQKLEKQTWNKVIGENLRKERLSLLDWCTCGGSEQKCSISHRFPKAAFCCKEASLQNSVYAISYRSKIGDHDCVTEGDEFYRRALDFEKIVGWAEMLREHAGLQLPETFENRELRRAAYRSVTLWIHGTLGTKLRVPLSSCIVNAIRNKFPNQGNVEYTDYASGGEASDLEDDEDMS